MRITGGKLRSRRLESPPGTQTRPTTDRVREALFSMIDARIDLLDARVLDLYAGTGALGIEALSRGAGHVVFVENERRAAQALRMNLQSLDLAASAKLIVNDVDRVTANQIGPEQIDLMLADPPYADVPSGRVGKVIDRLSPALSFSGGALFMLEHASRDDAPTFSRWELSLSRRHGDTTLSFYGPIG